MECYHPQTTIELAWSFVKINKDDFGKNWLSGIHQTNQHTHWEAENNMATYRTEWHQEIHEHWNNIRHKVDVTNLEQICTNRNNWSITMLLVECAMMITLIFGIVIFIIFPWHFSINVTIQNHKIFSIIWHYYPLSIIHCLPFIQPLRNVKKPAWYGLGVYISSLVLLRVI